ncbi:BadF/BadG/BcrA/BcrD ATPase family protein [Paracoccus tegillarcae]|uniref:ATPase n=1 Tax=Paracoccus tegillarcae TaxID=1529068 RepID=A0A2K9F0B2_9RHOB|nr:BadF/BadG/BcrA/BcrD ATPase family protein [Paracoccus tegillarcae]AUH33792.1 ATPase [Paracoccus tegillarcae]
MAITNSKDAGFALALDGGGTGCRAVLVDPDGQEIGRGQGGPANVNSDRDGALAAILDACQQALGGRVGADRVTAVMGLAGAEVSQAHDWLVPQLPFANARVVQDAVTAMVGALDGEDGIVAALGTGSVYSRRLDGKDIVVGGRGPIIGDQGGGNWLGRQLLARALETADGLHDRSPLMAEVLDKMGGVSGIITFAATARAADFAAHAPLVIQQADDPAARVILAEAERSIAAYIDRLQPADAALPVAFNGGLGRIFAGRLAGRWPMTEAKGSPLDGALLMARELVRQTA